MPTIYSLKPAFQDLLRPFSRALHSLGVTPNAVTLAALAGSFCMGIFMFLRGGCSTIPLYVLPVFLFVRMALNAVDGMIAKEHSLTSPSGAFLNEIGDVLSDAALYLPFAALPGLSPALVASAVVLAGVTELTGVIGQALGAPRRFDGPMGKSDRAVAFGVMGLAYAFGLRNEFFWDAIFWAVLALLVATIFNRARGALGAIRT